METIKNSDPTKDPYFDSGDYDEEAEYGDDNTEATRFYDLPIAALIAEYDLIRDSVEPDNKTRQEKILYVLLERLGIHDVGYKTLSIARQEIRNATRRHGKFVDWLFGSDALELLDGYIRISPICVWKHIKAAMLGERPYGRFGNERCSSQKGGARWGVYIYGIEIGSRNPDDIVGGWLKKNGLWPW